MKNVTLSADDDLVERARAIARSQRKTLNAAFREWLLEFTSREGSARDYDALMKRLNHVNAGRHFSRDEMNER
jgi:predicted transcriptional regulator